MALDRAAAFKTDRPQILALLHDLSDDEWAAPSKCEGWAVRDVVSHMGAACHGTFTPWVLKLLAGKDIEEANNRDAEKRKSWEPAKLLREYEVWGNRVAPAMKVVQAPGVRSLPVRVAEVGAYPAKMLTSAFVFDHGLHARYDIAVALGRTVPPQDENQLGVSLEWMMAGLSVMSGDRFDWLQSPVEFSLVGPAGGTWTVAPGKKRVKVTAGGTPGAAATIEGPAAGFPVWGTAREPWREAGVAIKGDDQIGIKFLDSMRII
ncbi:maleylpyruvate isomerase family mycothiol-dependent enzyme [Sporichthya sp.]|uniref:maleylpyruvate isomerase family mycothiol-dependent enzyme n=1 Tax=Sporichthya sp. TaxID=65475 RepID=UPI0017F4AE65|nr:maleylpyruvate isomerase family mycothiol-dependent enzyme [Sporichthya sp.]MBA3744296.1 maleylpyruvate isomerase family mycothiol-dependent enzyme [Sporichthya sp.]